MVSPSQRRTGLLVPVHEAAGLVGDFRRRHDADSVARRIPPHVTVLFPFAGADRVDDELRDAVARHFATIPGFGAELHAVGRFDDCVWLAPRPRREWVGLLAATWARFPAFPPYGGLVREPEPHLTIGAVDGAAAAARLEASAAAELGASLPFRFRVDSVSLFEEHEDGTWSEATGFPLA